MSDIVNLTEFKAAKKEKPSAEHAFNTSVDIAIAQWSTAYAQNKVLELLSTETKKTIDAYDLLSIKKLEEDIGVSPIVFAPKTLAKYSNTIGWVAGFRFGESTFSTPEMISEVDARAFNILLFTQFKAALEV